MKWTMVGAIFALGLVFGGYSPSAWAQEAKETQCGDGVDNDGDTVYDCGDADCAQDAACTTSGPEQGEKACSDWLDNDGDGHLDCEDNDCGELDVCKGSWKGPVDGTGAKANAGDDSIPDLSDGQQFENMIGQNGDIDGERNEFLCSDGVDNDSDGAIDCADIGCRFDPNVTVCRGTPGIRFSLAAHVQHSYDFENELWDTRVNRLQLRAFGPVPLIQDSFFLITIRAEAAPRLVFATFNLPLGGGHMLGINSGGGGLSNGQILSVSKNILLDPPFYLYSAFEQGNGAAIEANGPLIRGRLDYRGFIAGGSGRFNGNIGGRFFNTEERNYSFGVGGQLALYLIGRFDRWDTRFLYTKVPPGASLYFGARYDQREYERYVAPNINLLARFGRIMAVFEGYGKREFNFGAWQFAYNFQVGFLLWEKRIFLAADVGQFYASDFDEPTNLSNSELNRIADQLQWRLAAHWYVWRNSGLLTLLYTDSFREAISETADDQITRELRLEAQVRF